MTTSLYTMPPEWAEQKRIWLSWPHETSDWPGKFAPIPWVFAEIVRIISATQRVGLLVKSPAMQASVTDILERSHANLKHVDFLQVKTNRGWMRDCGPIWVKEGNNTVALNWKFTGWAKYPNHRLDNHVPEQVAAFTKHKTLIPMHKGKQVVLEGGGVEVDGAGSIIVTEEWLLSESQIRNPGFTRGDYEEIFAQCLGASNTIWLGKGIVGDDTHGHVDDITRFVTPGKIVTAIEHDKKDENYSLLQENLKRLKAAKDAQGRLFEIIALPMPRPVVFEGQRLPASYANFLICNKVVIVPIFNDPGDKEALNTLQHCFPDREVVGIYARDLVWGLGTMHCLTQQEPA